MKTLGIILVLWNLLAVVINFKPAREGDWISRVFVCLNSIAVASLIAVWIFIGF